ncbi:hypothetical protein SARC_03277 [Sphaeroforma arctica JP610]|uniref:J domain-containing protein n=1 Tax=Sphaeroforma arctica JP610 TaxID=667725 RepID=A0A0L0G8D3_9EUKA|nr:hypothetical protein SARC_03277 [Sphaeroforma arctica JP610]KNC84503.1 hypothetical protein SARC_03277 [Sphaeroforma arctica JP610]|eukprot:XP_014158405.1 hypothetical protein SARC_03277 [Sphaeroforma arctica JP610]
MAVRVEAVAQQSTPSQSHKPSAAQSSSSQTENSNTHTSDEALVTIRRIIEAEDYYEVLGVSREQSNPSLFRTQYIKLSKKIHPDKHLDNPEATNAFQSK